ncbi:hypothetical protein DUI87_16505 [Hirundo rustica rustica]|uniref:Uncharacterized protein n=1 Tax=Hirundo rustica rustica TaxID=333673 RepID=A0A3M0K1D6_HIRRU|nr:hypothetical protein DUI87_16505 [Hirundo rustica rustica]
MESGQASGQLPPKRGEQQAQLDVTRLSLAKAKKEKAHLLEIKGFYMGPALFDNIINDTDEGTKYALNKFEDDTKLSSEVDTPEVSTSGMPSRGT